MLFLRKPGMRGPNEQNKTLFKLGEDRNYVQAGAEGDGVKKTYSSAYSSIIKARR